MPHPLYLVDAFTLGPNRPFTGNPAAVCVLDGEADAAWMQAVAAEMNLSETAFLHPDPPSAAATPGPAAVRCWHLRWFTPAAEVELCGHATLAAAHVLWTTGRADPRHPLPFATRFRGTLTCTRSEDNAIAMDFPADPATPAPLPDGLLATLHLHDDPVRTARSRYDWLIELPDADAVCAAAPDFSALAAFDCRGVMLTAPGSGSRSGPDGPGDAAGPDVVSRFFAPRLRVAEDPVTGSAHCVLGLWWFDRLGRDTLQCEQLSARGGRLTVTRFAPDRVGLAGAAVTVLDGTLR